jgi:hypothetical protein
MLTLDLLKEHLKLAPDDTTEDALLTAYLAAAVGMFRIESKRRWPKVGEPAFASAKDPEATPPELVFVAYVDRTALSPDEQAIASQYLLLTLGHWYENRGSVSVGVNVTEVPDTAKALMKLLREPTL